MAVIDDIDCRRAAIVWRSRFVETTLGVRTTRSLVVARRLGDGAWRFHSSVVLSMVMGIAA